MNRILRTILVAVGLAGGLAGTAQAQSYFGGNIAVYITVQVATSSITVVNCEASVTNTNDSSGHLNSESGTLAASAVSGGIATCAVIIPYVWLLSSQGTDTFDVTYTVTGTGASGTTRTGTHTVVTGAAVPA